MATTTVLPLHLAGNTTSAQRSEIRNAVMQAIEAACNGSLEILDHNAADAILDARARLQTEVAASIAEILHRHTASRRFADEEVSSNRAYPATYQPLPIEAQVTELRKAFPALRTCQERIARRPLLEGAEDWFAIPRWQSLAPTYNEALEMVIQALAGRRRFSNRVGGRIGPGYLRHSERTALAQRMLCEQQPGQDILVLPAQFGMLHRGSSARRVRVAMAGHEFGLSTFAVASMLLTHPQRLSAGDTLMIDCSGDEYSFLGDSRFDRVPLFDYGISGIEFSIFYEDRARSLWGTPTGFLYRFE